MPQSRHPDGAGGASKIILLDLILLNMQTVSRTVLVDINRHISKICLGRTTEGHNTSRLFSNPERFENRLCFLLRETDLDVRRLYDFVTDFITSYD